MLSLIYIKVTVLLDVTPDEEMLNEGILRDIVNRIQRLRKDYKIQPGDNIDVYYQVNPAESKLDALLKKSIEYVQTNIKKPFKQYESGLKLNVAPKTFEVNKFLICCTLMINIYSIINVKMLILVYGRQVGSLDREEDSIERKLIILGFSSQ